MTTLLETGSDRLLAAVRLLLAEKGVATAPEIEAAIERTDRANPGQGATMVARAWTDPEFRALMLEDGAKAAESLGIPAEDEYKAWRNAADPRAAVGEARIAAAGEVAFTRLLEPELRKPPLV